MNTVRIDEAASAHYADFLLSSYVQPAELTQINQNFVNWTCSYLNADTGVVDEIDYVPTYQLLEPKDIENKKNIHQVRMVKPSLPHVLSFDLLKTLSLSNPEQLHVYLDENALKVLGLPRGREVRVAGTKLLTYTLEASSGEMSKKIRQHRFCMVMQKVRLPHRVESESKSNHSVASVIASQIRYTCNRDLLTRTCFFNYLEAHPELKEIREKFLAIEERYLISQNVIPPDDVNDHLKTSLAYKI